MSAATLIRYALDPTGVNPDNYVAGEVKTLTAAQMRAAGPKYGPFFTESMVIFDNGTNVLLVRGVDYELTDLVEEATLDYGKEIMQMILVKNPNVTNQIRLNYQLLGGLYQNNSEGLVDLYQAAVNDSRGVDWTLVLDKPPQYPPTPHLHPFSQIFGTGPIVVALERIRDAVVLSNIPAFESLIDWVKAYAGSSVFFDPTVTQLLKNAVQHFNITSSNKPNGTNLFWTIEHHGTVDTNFTAIHGTFTLFQNRGGFDIQLSSTPPIKNQAFDVSIRQDNLTGPILTTIEGIILIGENPNSSTGANSIEQLLYECCLYEPSVNIDATSLYILGGR